MKRSGNLRTQVTIIVILSFIVFSCALSFINLYSTYKLLQTESKERLISMAKYQASSLSEAVIQRQTVAEGVSVLVHSTFDTDKASDPSYWDEYIEEIDPYIYNLASKYEMAYLYMNPFIHRKARDVWYWDEDRDGTPELQPHTNYDYYLDDKNKPWFFLPMNEKRPNWTDPYPTTILSEDIKWISYTIPVYMDNLFVGVVGSDMDYYRFEQEFKDIVVYNTGYAVLINDKGDFIVHPEIEEKINLADVRNGEYAWMLDEINRSKVGTFEYKWIDGKEKILAYARVSNGWAVGITAEKTEIYGSLIDNMKLLVGIIVVGVALTGLSIFTLIGTRMRMLEGVTETITDIGNGNYDIEFSEDYLDSNNEVGELAQAVEVMKVKQKAYMGEIKNYSENLEQLVEKRTAELEDMNQELELSLEQLKNTQGQLIESQKTEAISRLIVEIAHRMNTPLGNVSMSVSYLEHMLEKLEEDNDKFFNSDMHNVVSESIRVVSVETAELSEIVRGLQLLTVKIEDRKLEAIAIKDILQLSISDFNNRNRIGERLNVDIVDHENIKIVTSPVHFIEAFHYLFKYTMDFSIRDERKKYSKITVVQKDDQISIRYEDDSNLSYTDFGERAFEPFALSSFKKGTSGVELMMAFNIVSVGLKGCIECLEGEDGKPYFIISLPIEGE